ncbi:phosphotransferase family protein [Halobacillus sp. B23F22_1]|uniref:phosphotransferase family protein n=1 Tax=Halobacillus sp. B23F22_1 TaxID=3459514 RepID=UPI00373F81DD
MEKYIQLEKRLYVNKNISLLKLIVILFFKINPLLPHTNKHKKILLYIKIFLKSKSRLIYLPKKGDLVMKVSDTNYKVFSTSNNIIYNLYHHNYERLAEKQFNLIKYNRMINLVKWDKKNMILEEYYINGNHPTYAYLVNNPKVCSDLFVKMIKLSKVKKINSDMYFNTLKNGIFDNLKKNTYILSKTQTKCISDFVEESINYLNNNFPMTYIPQVVTHGDITCNNLIIYKNNLIPIDWEFCDFRSPIFDIQFFLNKLEMEKQIDSGVSSEIKVIASNADYESQEIKSFFRTDREILYKLYLIEYVYLVLSQIEFREFAKDIEHYVIRYLATY